MISVRIVTRASSLTGGQIDRLCPIPAIRHAH
jgi:hypothetical protein